jgi:hypothetical protein
MSKKQQKKSLPELSVSNSEEVRGGSGIDASKALGSLHAGGVDGRIQPPSGQTPPTPRPRGF